MQKFRYNSLPFVSNLFRIHLWLVLLLVGATIIGQLRADRFPAYHDLGIALLLPGAAFIIIALLVLLGCRFYTVDVDTDGIRSQNPFGLTMTMAWEEIVYAELVYKYRIPYLVLRVSNT